MQVLLEMNGNLQLESYSFLACSTIWISIVSHHQFPSKGQGTHLCMKRMTVGGILDSKLIEVYTI
jgi:hypothetical protein